MTTVTLKHPVEAYGETVTTLTFRPPIGKDIRKCGMLFYVEEGDDAVSKARNHVDMDAAAQYMVLLGNVPPSTIDNLNRLDFMECLKAITGFFGEPDGPTISLPDTTTSRGNGSSIPKPSLATDLKSSSALSNTPSAS